MVAALRDSGVPLSKLEIVENVPQDIVWIFSFEGSKDGESQRQPIAQT